MDAGADTSAADASADAAIVAAPFERVFEGLGDGDRVTFELDRPVLGLQLLLEGSGFVGVRAVDAAGTSVIAEHAWVGLESASTFQGEGIVAVNLPGSDLLLEGIPQGHWEVEVTTTGSATLTVRGQSGTEGVFVAGRLDVDLWLPEGLTIGADAHPVTPESAATDDDVQVRLDAFFQAASELFVLERGEVRVHTVPADFVTVDSYAELAAAVAATSDHGPSAHFLWTDGISFEGYEVWGVTSGLPGAADHAGTGISAVVVDVSAGFPAVADGYTMAHELGHFAGLNHTTELAGDSADLFADTPRCADIATSPRTCADASNLMFPIFWGASGGDPTRIVTSPSQRRVVAGTLLYRAEAAAGRSSARRARLPTVVGVRDASGTVHAACGMR